MKSSVSRYLLRILTALALVCLLSIWISAQEVDTDPNSPTPVLLSQPDSTYALVVQPKTRLRVDAQLGVVRPIPEYSTIQIFTANIAMMDGEGANAFRVTVEDSGGRNYRFPVLAIAPTDLVKSDTQVYAVTVLLKDELGFWDAPPADGDVLIGLTWRGLASNRVKIGFNQVGGKIKDDPGAVPTPPTTTAKATSPLRLRNSVGTKQTTGSSPSPNYIGYRWSGDRLRFLEQATFGPTAALDARIRRIGLRTWLAEQFDYPYPSINNPYPNQVLKPGNAPADCDNDQVITPDVPVTCFRDTYSMYQPQTWFFREALYGDAQLRHRVSWALAEIWVTSGVDIQQGRHIVEYQKILANNAFGNYRTLMKQMTLSPTMGDYLSMSQSTRTNPNENYAREIMQLFTIGLFMLNQDGTVQTDVNGPIPSYDQNNVNNLTKVMTGWSFCSVVASCPNIPSGSVNFIDPMLLNGGVGSVGNNRHDLTAKTLLNYPGAQNVTIPACPTTGPTACAVTTGVTTAQALANIQTYANTSLDQALDNLFNHPNVGPFVSKRLIQQMVTSDPTPAYVGRVTAIFNNNGFGVRGDLKAVVKAILLDPEARGDVKTDPSYGKLREPVQLATNYARSFGVRSADGTTLSDGNFVRGRSEFTNMSQSPYLSPTVFNFYPPDYIIPGTATNGPEFAVLNTGTAIARANFFNRMVFSVVAVPVPGSAPIPVSNPDSPNGTSFDFSDLQALVVADTSSNQLVDELNRRMLHSTMSATMKNTIITAVNAVAVSNPPTADQTLTRVKQAIYLVATSSQYQVQR
ncbi:MAG: DUF1800 family protein [Acidobacteriota bacterium]